MEIKEKIVKLVLCRLLGKHDWEYGYRVVMEKGEIQLVNRIRRCRRCKQINEYRFGRWSSRVIHFTPYTDFWEDTASTISIKKIKMWINENYDENVKLLLIGSE
ncbi:MAG TPA: hypothetical protein ENG66_01080 [Thermococcus sp.]|nr:hypothetical protein [Thermococcus sp.]